MSLSSECSKTCTAEIVFKDHSSVILNIAIPFNMIVEHISIDEYGNPTYKKMSHEEQLKLQIPFIKDYIETWCDRHIKADSVLSIEADYYNYKFSMEYIPKIVMNVERRVSLASSLKDKENNSCLKNHTTN